MLTRTMLYFFALILSIEISNAQGMEFYADVMINADMAKHRQIASEEFRKLMAEDLSHEGSFGRAYENLPWISIQYPEDKTFRVISWQVDVGDGNYQYRGYLQLSNGINHEIGAHHRRQSYDSNDVLNIENWAGGLIYKIITVDHQDVQYYALTFRQDDAHTKVKTLEPLTFNDNQIKIGQSRLFEDESSPYHLSSRLAITYSADSNASITYEQESDRFIFDHLIKVRGRMAGQGPTQVPDGSYHAYEWVDNRWKYVDKLYSETNQGALNPNQNKKLNKKLFRKG